MAKRPPVVQVRRLPHHDGLPLPTRQISGSAGYDVHSAEPDFTLQPLERRLVCTGLALAIPPGYEAQVRPRSGLALKHGLTLPNTPATIDSDYRGELMIAVINLGTEPVECSTGSGSRSSCFSGWKRWSWWRWKSCREASAGRGGLEALGLDPL